MSGGRVARAPLAITVTVFAAMYTLLSVYKHRHFGSGFDLAIFDQAIWHLSRFEIPASSIRGFANLFGDHFHPILLVLAPLYRIAPAAETLIVTQAVLLALSLVPVHVFARHRLSHGAALGITIAYGLFWGLQRTAVSDFHELAFAPLLIACALLAIDRRRWGWMWIVCVALMAVKEDLIPLVGTMGALLWLRGERRQGIILLVGSLIVFALVMKVVIPWFNAGTGWAYQSAFDELRARPWTAPVLLVTPVQKLVTVANWLLPFAGLPLLSPFAILLAPLAAGRLLSTATSHWMAMGHYSAPLAPILAMSAADGLARLAARMQNPSTRRRVVGASVSACVLVSAFLPGHQPHWRVFNPRHYRDHPTQRTGLEALAAIPRDASVVAQTALLPHLSQRNQVYVLEAGVPDADYVIASAGVSPWPQSTWEEVAALLAERRQRGYQVVFSENEWVVLRR